MNDENLRRRIAALAANSSTVEVRAHARKRMRERRVTLTQVLDVLRKGRVVQGEGAHLNIHGNWECKLERIVAGDRISEVAAVCSDGREAVIVVTVVR